MITYRPLTTLQMSDLFDGQLEKLNVLEHHSADRTSSDFRCLTDGVNYVWVAGDEDGAVSSLTRWLPNGNPRHILACIAEAFGVAIVSEFEPEYWGFDSQDAWDAALGNMQQESEDRPTGNSVMGAALERVLHKLRGVTYISSKGWLARCPAHDDQHHSLQISGRTDLSVGLHCHAGCDKTAVLAAMGLTVADLSATTDQGGSNEREGV